MCIRTRAFKLEDTLVTVPHTRARCVIHNSIKKMESKKLSTREVIADVKEKRRKATEASPRLNYINAVKELVRYRVTEIIKNDMMYGGMSFWCCECNFPSTFRIDADIDFMINTIKESIEVSEGTGVDVEYNREGCCDECNTHPFSIDIFELNKKGKEKADAAAAAEGAPGETKKRTIKMAKNLNQKLKKRRKDDDDTDRPYTYEPSSDGIKGTFY